MDVALMPGCVHHIVPQMRKAGSALPQKGRDVQVVAVVWVVAFPRVARAGRWLGRGRLWTGCLDWRRGRTHWLNRGWLRTRLWFDRNRLARRGNRRVSGERLGLARSCWAGCGDDRSSRARGNARWPLKPG